MARDLLRANSLRRLYAQLYESLTKQVSNSQLESYLSEIQRNPYTLSDENIFYHLVMSVFGLDCGDKPEASENWELAEELLPSGRSSDYIHALIDFGAEVCTASNPNCEDRPLEGICEYSPEESS